MLPTFARHFFQNIWHVRAVIVVIIALVVTGAGAIAFLEKMPFSDALYFSFITGLTIGFGDIVVQTPLGRLVAILIGLIGILFTGLMVAVMVHAVRVSYEKPKDSDRL